MDAFSLWHMLYFFLADVLLVEFELHENNNVKDSRTEKGGSS